MLPLFFRRDVLDLKFVYKCLNGLYQFDISRYVTFARNSNHTTRNSSDPNLLKIPLCKTTTFRNSYFNRIVFSWNSLPLNIRTAENVRVFSNKLKTYFLALTSGFNPECCCSLYLTCECLKLPRPGPDLLN